MRQSKFSKKVSATGPLGTFEAVVIATMNYSSTTVSGTHAGTHDDFSKKVPIHKVEVFIDERLFASQSGLKSESAVLEQSKKLIEEAQAKVIRLANEAPVKSFVEKMTELFS